MKKIFITLFAVIATASVVQASNKKHTNLPEYNVTAEQFQFIDARLEAVVHELVAEALANPIPESVLRDERSRNHTMIAATTHTQSQDRMPGGRS